MYIFVKHIELLEEMIRIRCIGRNEYYKIKYEERFVIQQDTRMNF